MHATVSLAGQQVMSIDSAVKQLFGLTPVFSLFVTCDPVEEITRLADKRFAVSWQLSLR